MDFCEALAKAQGCYLNTPNDYSNGRKVQAYMNTEGIVEDSKLASFKATLSRKTVRAEPSQPNILTQMRKFYQSLYVKVSKQVPKDGSSKKKVLERLGQNLKNTESASYVSLPDVIVHLGSVIYPSKVNKTVSSIVGANLTEGEDSKKAKAKLLVAQFQECMFSFSCKKLEKLLQNAVFNFLYQYFCRNLEASLYRKVQKKEGQPTDTLNMLTDRINHL